MTSDRQVSTTTRWIAPAVFAVGAAAGVVVVRRRRGRAERAAGTPERWLVVTIDRTPEEVMPQGVLPTPLTELGDQIEVAVAVAPGGKGTELRARPLSGRQVQAPLQAKLTGDDPRSRLRVALRHAKQLIETGEVLLVDPVPHGHRPHTPQGKLVDFASARANRVGRL